MSVYIQFDDGNGKPVEGDQIATSGGWLEFGEWAMGLNVEEAEAIVQLWEHGKTFREPLEKQLNEQRQDIQPSPLLDIIWSILDELKENPSSEGVWIVG